MPPTALVTGGTGFVGGAVVRALVEQRWDVVALARTEASAGALARAGARPALGDVCNPDSIRRAVTGCDVVFHAAGLNASCLPDTSPLFRVNVEGTRNVLEAAARAGVRRFVHTSSAAAIGEPVGTIGREDTAHRGWFLTAYERSKFDAERLVLERGPALGLEVVCVEPASVQGPGRAEGSARLLLAAARGRLPLAVDAWLSFVDIDDCALGHVRAAERGRLGERYILSGGSVRVRQALRLLRAVTGRPFRTWFVPGRAVLPAAALVEVAVRAVGRTPPVCREVVRAGLHGHRYDGSRATRELGLTYTPLEETLRRTVAWFAAQGLLREGPPRPAGRPAIGSAYDGDLEAEPTRPHTRTRRWLAMTEMRPDRNLAMELVRVTEAAALAAGRWVGRGDKEAADQAAVDAMRGMIDTVSMHGTVVIGEGEKDRAPMLYNGEEVGNGGGPAVDVAVDPIDGTRLTATGQPNALAVIALAERGSMFFPGAAVYMEKVAAGPESADAIDVTASPEENVRLVAKAQGVRPEEVGVVILDRDRHKEIIARVREAGARAFLITDGDVAGAIATARPSSGIDLLLGIGGTPEGVIAAAALKCLGGAIQGRLYPRGDDERRKLLDDGFDLERVLTADDLVAGEDVFFAATGITDGSLLRGVRYDEDGAITHSLVMRSRSGTVRYIDAEHRFEKLEKFSGVTYRP